MGEMGAGRLKKSFEPEQQERKGAHFIHSLQSSRLDFAEVRNNGGALESVSGSQSSVAAKVVWQASRNLAGGSSSPPIICHHLAPPSFFFYNFLPFFSVFSP